MAVKYQSRSSKLTLAVTSSPTTTQYIVGDTLNLSGMVVTATRRDGTPVNVTSSCTFSPANGSSLSSSGTQNITITYQGKSITTSVSVYVLNRIAVTTAPTKTSYKVGETISYSGIVVKAYANSDNIVRTVTSECSYSPASGTTLSSTGSFSSTITWRTKSTTQAYTVSAKIYGAEWAGGSSSAWTRTDDASGFSAPVAAVNNGIGSSPFDNIMPWSGMRRVEERTAYAGNQVLVEIPKFYYKWTRTGSKMKLQISMYKGSGFYTSPAHADRGDGKGERDYVYVGAYHTTKVGNFWYSLSGTTPTVNITRATARSGIHNTNSTQWQWDFAMYWTIAMLYLVEYADWNTQAKIGYGCGNGSSADNTGQTDAMTYHTGTNKSTRTTYGHVRYRYIEDLWANVADWVDGIYATDSGVFGIKNPANFSDNSGGTKIGSFINKTTLSRMDSFVQASASGFEYALLPGTLTESPSIYSAYICDGYVTVGSSPFVFGVGGWYNAPAEEKGMFRYGFMNSDTAVSIVGTRLMKLP